MHVRYSCLYLTIFLSFVILTPVSTAYPGTIHKVQSGDTLWSIAKKYGVSVQSIQNTNGLHNPNRLNIGQKLSIPEKRVSTDSNPSSRWNFRYNRATLNKLLTTSAAKQKWRYIVIHHSATPNGSAKAFDYFHRAKRHMRNGLAYHFVIGNGNGSQNGKIEVGNRWKKQLPGGHCSNQRMNEIGIGICLVGNFQKTRPTSRQLESLAALVRVLQAQYGIPKSRVIVHKEVKQKSTLCPGKYFPADQFRRML